ncbi:MAG: PGPGW domain-containing protein [Acidobacteriia bacterium]|nr:PGPGW domain-containing protein [Terriglobia bacterium]
MKEQLKRVALLAVGWGFILLGIAGLFLPVLQGILFLLIGLFILSSEYVWAHKLLYKLKLRFPHIAEHFEHARQRSEAWMARTLHKKKPPVKARAPGTDADS